MKQPLKAIVAFFVVEIMGHKVGHICLQAGIAAGVDAILLPEIPYDIKVVAKKIKENQKTGKEIITINCLCRRSY